MVNVSPTQGSITRNYPTDRDFDVDVVVLGAGVAGLLMAADLSARFRVLLVERSSRIPVNKYWLTSADSAAANPHFSSAIDTTYTSLDFVAYDETLYRCQGDYRLWDTGRLLECLTQQILSRGGVIRCGSTFYSYRMERNCVVVLVDDVRIRARLVLDCMGVGSPIIYAEDLIRIDGYYLLHGASFGRLGDFAPVAFHNFSLSDRPAYVEAFPTSDGRLHLILITATSQLTRTSSLQGDFAFVSTRSPYAKYIDPSVSRERRHLGGIVPVGRLKRRALNRMAFYGEAGQVNPAASATGLTRMLLTHAECSARLGECLDRDQLDANALSRAMPEAVDRTNRAVQRSLFRQMLRWRSRDFHKIVAELNRVGDHQLANDLIFASLKSSNLPSYAAHLLRERATTLLGTLLHGVF